MTNKEKFMDYARKRIHEKQYREKKASQEAYEVYVKGFERCVKEDGRWGKDED